MEFQFNVTAKIGASDDIDLGDQDVQDQIIASIEDALNEAHPQSIDVEYEDGEGEEQSGDVTVTGWVAEVA
jgi:hypothetical protein